MNSAERKAFDAEKFTALWDRVVEFSSEQDRYVTHLHVGADLEYYIPIRVTTENAWFAARPSGTENIYKVYAESFKGAAHLDSLIAEAQQIVTAALKGFRGGSLAESRMIVILAAFCRTAATVRSRTASG